MSSGIDDVPGRLMARDMIGRLGAFRRTNPWNHSLLVYDVGNDLVVSETVTSAERFADRDVLEQARSASVKTALSVRVVDGSRVLTLLYPYKYFAGSTTAAVIINLDYVRFFEAVSSHADGSTFRVYDGSGAVLYRPTTPTGSSYPVDLTDLRSQRDLLVLQVPSPGWDWTYVYAQTYATIVGVATHVRWLIIGATMLVAILSTALAQVVARRLYRPLSDLVGHVERLSQTPHGDYSNKYDVIDTAIEQLASENNRLAEAYRTAVSFFRRHSLAELLHAKRWDEDRFRTILESLDITFTREATYLVIIETRSGTSVELRNAVESFLVRHEHDVSSAIAIEATRRVSVLVNMNGADEHPPQIVCALYENLGARKPGVTISVSDVLRDLDNMPGAYAETKRRLEIGAFFGTDGIVSSRHEPTDRAPADPESSTDRLQSAIDSLNRDEFRAVLEELAAETLGVESDAVARARFLFYHAGSRIQDTASRYGLKLATLGPDHVDLFKSAEALGSSDEITSVLGQALSELIDETNRVRQDRKTEAVRQAMDYMEKNYARDISIEEIARSVYLSSRYLNALFNEETGVPVHKALTEIRLDHARRLLKDAPQMSVAQTAAAVGYASPHSFMRMFKRHSGVTPIMYRRNLARAAVGTEPPPPSDATQLKRSRA